jgi:hypothetical protein
MGVSYIGVKKIAELFLEDNANVKLDECKWS